MSPEDDVPAVHDTVPPGRPKIVLFGVGHVFDLRAAVRETILRVRPQTVALELDAARFQGLMTRGRGQGRGMPLLYRMLARLQENIADQYGTEVGGEMTAAAEAASEIGARVALIDMDARRVFRRLRGALSWKEKLWTLLGAFMSLFTRSTTIEKELDRYGSDEERYMSELREHYPAVVRVLIDERNEFMAANLRRISQESETTIAVVGDGHIAGLSGLLAGAADVEVLRLSEIRAPPAKGNNTEMSYSFVLDRGERSEGPDRPEG